MWLSPARKDRPCLTSLCVYHYMLCGLSPLVASRIQDLHLVRHVVDTLVSDTIFIFVRCILGSVLHDGPEHEHVVCQAPGRIQVQEVRPEVVPSGPLQQRR